MNKKGVFEIQFNWIFILIIGAIILLFFSFIILRQKDISEVSTSSLILKNLEAIFSGTESSLDTVSLISIPETKIEFSCNSYRVGRVSKQLDNMEIFTPSKIESSKLITWTLDWSLPYRVTNFLYLTSPRIRYIFVGNTAFARDTFNSMPNETNRDIYGSVENIVNKDDDEVRIIFFEGTTKIPNVFTSMPVDTVTALEVNGDEDTGDITFFKFNNNQIKTLGRSKYLQAPSLLGAIFSDDIGLYECVIKNSFKKLEIISEIYGIKTDDLKDYYSSVGNSICRDTHSEASAIIRSIKTASGNFNPSSVNSINSDAVSLGDKNKKAQLFSCAMIY